MGEFTDKLKGRFKSVTGKVTGNRRLEAEGEADEAKGKVKGGVEEVKHDIKEVVRGEPPSEY